MKLGIIGLPQAGKTTVFEALTRNIGDAALKREGRIGTIKVPDDRVGVLSRLYNPKKTIFAQVEYFLPAAVDQGQEKNRQRNILTQVRDCDALIHVVRNFSAFGTEKATIKNDFAELDQELILSDLMVVEKKLERFELEQKRGKKPHPEEVALINQCHTHLNNETPLRQFPELAQAHRLRGYAFLSAKPMLVLFNNEDEDDAKPEIGDLIEPEGCMVIRAKLEQELAQMSDEEALDFLSEFNISAPAMDRVIKKSYALLGLISFFTVGEDEVRAWTIRRETAAVDAAEVIHSDIKKGFIRAEVLAYDDLMEAGNYAQARKNGTVRLEGKTYTVADGDIINFRFNV